MGLSIHLLPLIAFLFVSAFAHSPYLPQEHHSPIPPIIVSTCKASRDPTTCQHVINQSGHVSPGSTVRQVILSLLHLTLHNLHTAEVQLKNIKHGSNMTRAIAANNSLEPIDYSRYRVGMTVRHGLSASSSKLKDSRAWLSAALSSQYDGLGGLRKVNDSKDAIDAMAFMNNALIATTSTALSMLANYDFHGEKTWLWGPIYTERDGFWEPADKKKWSDFKDGGGRKILAYNVTVCKTGGCDYRRVQDAVDPAPESKPAERFVIWIKAGVYNETVRVSLYKYNVVFVGDGMGKTVITGCLNAGQPGMGIFHTATVGVLGDGFTATNITFENTAVGYQAVAFRSDADRTVMEHCEFRGNQDTLYAKSLRQYYKSCHIRGNVDFIFGNAAAFFQDCKILIAPRPAQPEAGEDNTITAQGRLEPGQSTGFVFHKCSINGTEKYMKIYLKNRDVHNNFLGRPWKEHSRTVFIRCNYGGLISKKGWMVWDGEFALKTLYYGELE
ncbi:unnamed protein product, partial [Cuscuta epithymum]